MPLKSPTINGTLHLVNQTVGGTFTLFTPIVDSDVLYCISAFNKTSSSSSGMQVSIQWTPPGQSQQTLQTLSVGSPGPSNGAPAFFVRAAAGTAVNVVVTFVGTPPLPVYDLDAVASVY